MLTGMNQSTAVNSSGSNSSEESSCIVCHRLGCSSHNANGDYISGGTIISHRIPPFVPNEQPPREYSLPTELHYHDGVPENMFTHNGMYLGNVPFHPSDTLLTPQVIFQSVCEPVERWWVIVRGMKIGVLCDELVFQTRLPFIL
jgi:hypothetical protein